MLIDVNTTTCKLVLTPAEEANFAPTRFEAAIEAGQSTRYQHAEGKSLEFGCLAPGAQDHLEIAALGCRSRGGDTADEAKWWFIRHSIEIAYSLGIMHFLQASLGDCVHKSTGASPWVHKVYCSVICWHGLC